MNTAYTPEDVARKNKSLFVPIYQRLFVWEMEQITRLLEDLYDAYKRNKEDRYYVGIVTVKERKEDGGWEVVDGQQRLTFLTLFAAVRVAQDDKTWMSFLYKDSKELRIFYVGRPSDRVDVKAIACGQGTWRDVKNANMRTFLACWEAFKHTHFGLDGKETDKSVEGEFSEYVYKRASFLVSQLPVSYASVELNLFFEKMNSAGRQLSVCDVIKGTYFPDRASIFDDCLNFDKSLLSLNKDYGDENFNFETSSTTSPDELSIRDLFEKGNNDYKEEPQEDAVDRYGARGLLSDETLLLHVLWLVRLGNDKQDVAKENYAELIKKIKEFRKDTKELQGLFREICDKQERNDFLRQMVLYRKWLDSNIIHIEYDARGQVGYKLGYDSDEGSQCPGEFIQFQSMMYVSSSEKQYWILASYLGSKDSELKLEDLKEIDRAAHPLPPSIDSMRYPSIDRYWFWRLDYVLWRLYSDVAKAKDINDVDWCKLGLPKLEKDELDYVLGYVFRTNRSIEHLHPQTPQTENAESEDWRVERREDGRGMIDSFGNLAMISSSLNSAQQNDGVGIKFERLKEKMVIGMGGLESIKMYVMFKLAKENPESWSVKLSEEHGAKMFELLKNEKAGTMENANVA